MSFALQSQKRIACILQESADLHTRLIEEAIEPLTHMAETLIQSFRSGGKLLLFGNGGSAADAQHVAAEFVGRFQQERRGLPAIALTTDSSAVTSISNDYGYEQVFARQIEAFGVTGDVVLAISASGNSPNVIVGVERAKELGLVTFGLAGGSGGKLALLANVCITVPSKVTARVQECHLALEHILCELVEEALFGEPK
ncbi:MAG: D-sedoheptulose 7-phosphate isomerase [Chthonomonadaceae bacterium]|nr:D-sedoheptulose 7-phosphate isomerase [Chthonomonadaceae bacterium]